MIWFILLVLALIFVPGVLLLAVGGVVLLAIPLIIFFAIWIGLTLACYKVAPELTWFGVIIGFPLGIWVARKVAFRYFKAEGLID
jgi:hypothetical protein